MPKLTYHLTLLLLVTACTSPEPDVQPYTSEQPLDLSGLPNFVHLGEEVSPYELKVLERGLPCCYDPVLDPIHKRTTKKIDFDGDGYASRWEIDKAWEAYYERVEEDALFTRRAFELLQFVVDERPLTADSPLEALEITTLFARLSGVMPSYKEWSHAFDSNQDNKIDLGEYNAAKAYYDATYDRRNN